MEESLKNTWKKYQPSRKRIGLIHTQPALKIPSNILKSPQTIFFPLGISPVGDPMINGTKVVTNSEVPNPVAIAHGLFHALRELDNQAAEIVIVEGISEENEGLAVMNRLRKAASEIIRKY